MQPEERKPEIAADDAGIHFLRSGRHDHPVVEWGEIEQVCAWWQKGPEGTEFLEVFVDHFSGVDFRFQNVEIGYERVMAAMAKHLIGFSRARAEAMGHWKWEDGEGFPVVWRPDLVAQPFELRPPSGESPGPTPELPTWMEVVRQVSVENCERLLGRTLEAEEKACVHTSIEDGRIIGNIRFPLSATLVRRQAELSGRAGSASAS